MEKTNEVEIEFHGKSLKDVCAELLLITCRKLDLQSSMTANSSYMSKTTLKLVLKGCPRKLNFSTFYWGKK